MRLSIRWQLAVVSVTLSLLPIAVTGVVAYRSARGALDQSIRFNLETLASQTDEKLERLLLDRQQSLRGWSQLRLIQDDTVTGDADGRVLQFLQDAKRNFDLNQELWVASAAGTVIASTLPTLRGREVGDRDWLQAARRGETWVGSARDAGSDRPRRHAGRRPAVQASFDRSKTVGVFVAVLDWPKIVEILQSVKVLPEGQNERGYLRAGRHARLHSHRAAVRERMGGRQDARSTVWAWMGLEQVAASSPGGQRDARRARCDVSHRLRHERAQGVSARYLASRPADAHGRGVRPARHV